MLDIDENVALRVAANAAAGGEIDGDARRRGLIGCGIVAATAIDAVGTRAPREGVVGIVADQRVGSLGADQSLDIDEVVAGGEAARAFTRSEADADRALRILVADEIVAAAAIDRIGAGRRIDRVVAAGGVDDVAGRIAIEHDDAFSGRGIGEDLVSGIRDVADAD